MSSKLREALRGILLGLETGVLLIGDGLGALIEALEPKPGGGPAEGYDPGPLPDGRPLGQAYTLSDLAAMRGSGPHSPYQSRLEELAHAGYGNPAILDQIEAIRDDEQTRRQLDPDEQIRPGEPDYAHHVEELRRIKPLCGAVQPWQPGQAKPYLCDRPHGHDGDHSASGTDDDGGEWLEQWTDTVDRLKQ